MIYDVIPGFKKYFYSLSPQIREQVLSSRVEFSSIGELMRLTEQLTEDNEHPYALGEPLSFEASTDTHY